MKTELIINDDVLPTESECPKLIRTHKVKTCVSASAPNCIKEDIDTNFVGRVCKPCNNLKNAIRYALKRAKIDSEKEILQLVEKNEK